MDQRFSDYLTQYKANCSFTETEREQTEVCGVRITVTLYEYDIETEHRDRAEILMEKDSLRYGCEGIERTHWDFLPVTVDGRPYILFSKTLYGFTLIDPDTLTEAYDYFPEKVYDGEESFIITDAKTFGRYLIFEGCYWGCPYEFSVYDHQSKKLADLLDHYKTFNGESRIEGDRLILSGLGLNREPTKVCLTEQEIDGLISEYGVTDF
ncbi:MAG: hypothetical protein J6B24_11210 [Clostridia bacterium]|nr:hypothetical protein [Clostridia bacterium]